MGVKLRKGADLERAPRHGLGEPIAVLDGLADLDVESTFDPLEVAAAREAALEGVPRGGSGGARMGRPFFAAAIGASAPAAAPAGQRRSADLAAPTIHETLGPGSDVVRPPGGEIDLPESGGVFDCPAIGRLGDFESFCFPEGGATVDYLKIPASSPVIAIRADVDRAEFTLPAEEVVNTPGLLEMLVRATPVLRKGEPAVVQDLGSRSEGCDFGELDPGGGSFCVTSSPADFFRAKAAQSDDSQSLAGIPIDQGGFNQDSLTDLDRVIARADHPTRGAEFWFYYLYPGDGSIRFVWQARGSLPSGGATIEERLEDVFAPAIEFIEGAVDVVGEILDDLVQLAKELGCAFARDQLRKLQRAAKRKGTLDEEDAREISDATGVPLPEIDAATQEASTRAVREIGNQLIDSVCGGRDRGGDASEESFLARHGVLLAVGGAVAAGAFLLS